VECVPGRAVVSVSISLGPGEQALFACGVKRVLLRRWWQVRLAQHKSELFAMAVVYFFAGVGWLVSPFLRDGVSLAVLYLPVSGNVIPLCYVLAKPITCSLGFAMLAAWLIRLARVPQVQANQNALSPIGSPYYLERRPASEPGANVSRRAPDPR